MKNPFAHDINCKNYSVYCWQSNENCLKSEVIQLLQNSVCNHKNERHHTLFISFDAIVYTLHTYTINGKSLRLVFVVQMIKMYWIGKIIKRLKINVINESCHQTISCLQMFLHVAYGLFYKSLIFFFVLFFYYCKVTMVISAIEPLMLHSFLANKRIIWNGKCQLTNKRLNCRMNAQSKMISWLKEKQTNLKPIYFDFCSLKTFHK